MASQEAHHWWADVQDEREALGGRRRRRDVAVWADDDFDLVPENLVGRRPVSDELAPRRAARYAVDPDAVEAPVRGHRFVRAPQPEPREAAAEVIDYVQPPRGETVIQIKGRPDERRPLAPARDRDQPRRPPRTARERVEHQPDRIMLWVTAIGFLLILLAFVTG